MRRLPSRLSRQILTLVALLFVTAVGSAQEGDALSADSAVVALVDGQPVRAAAYRSTYFIHLVSTGQHDTPATRRTHLNALVDLYLLAAEARRRGFEAQADFQDFADRRIRQLVGSHYFAQTLVDSLPPPSEEALREAYRRTHESRHLRHLFFRRADEAERAYRRLESGEDFVRLANEIYQTPRFDSLAGVLGPAGYWDLDAAVAEAAYTVPVGAYTAPVRSRDGWHIVRVEDLVYNPLLVEDAFQARKAKVAARVRERQMRLEGRQFLEEMMSSVGLEMNAEAVRQLHQAARQMIGAPASGAVNVPPLDSEIAQLREVLTPETVLATYLFEGRRYELTAGTYVRWLPDLPAREVRSNLAASIGRVLRDEVLAERGFAAGFAADPAVQHDIQHVTSLFLAERLAAALSADTLLVPTEDEVQRAFEALGSGGLARATADFWTIAFTDPAGAKEAQQALDAGNRAPSDFEGYRLYEGADVLGLGSLGRHVRTAPPGQTVLLGEADGTWRLLHVVTRAERTYTIEERRAELTRLLKPHLAQMRLLARLRADARISVDEAAFEAALPAFPPGAPQ